MEMMETTETKQVKTEKNEIDEIKQQIASLVKENKKLNIALKEKVEGTTIEDTLKMLELYLDKQASKPKKVKWRNRTLTLFPNDSKMYLTSEQIIAKKIVDKLIKDKTFSTTGSITALNTFLGNAEIRALSPDLAFFAKMYYKQFYLTFPGQDKRGRKK